MQKRNIIKLILFFCLIFIFIGKVNAADITYSGSTISLNSGSATLDDLYNTVDNPAVLSKAGTEYILTANINISYSATLTIDAPTAGGITLKFNEPAHNAYGIINSGTVNINNAVITSSTGNAWYIQNPNVAWYLNQNPSISINNTDMSLCGASPNPCIQLGKYNDEVLPNMVLNWTNVTLHDTLGYYALFLGYAPYWVNISNSTFYNLKWRMIDLTRGIIRNSKFYNLDTLGTSGVVIISWGMGGSVYDSEFYNINIGLPIGGYLFICKEGSGGCIFQNNYIHDVNMNTILGVYGSQQTNASIYRDNLIERATVGGDGVIFWRSNQYNDGSGVYNNLTSQIYNNTIRDITGPGLVWHSGGQNAKIWNNTLSNVSGLDFLANYQRSLAWGGIYHPGDSAGSIIYDMNFPGNIRIYDLDDPADQSIHGKLLPFVNVKYNSVVVSMPDDYFYDYKYLDVKVVDSIGNPINGATVTVANNVDSNYPPINMYRTAKTSLLTGIDGHTPLPSDLINTIAILDFWKTSATQQEMAYTITASYAGKTASATVTPDTTWYRPDPNVSAKTITIQLPTSVVSPAIDINQDGVIDISDLRLVALHFGETTALPYPRYDINADGTVDILDLRQVAGGM